MNDFEKWLKAFLKCPILPEQEAAIICAMMDGRLNKQGAIKVFKLVIEQNLEAHRKIMAMSEEEILQLIERIDNAN